MVNLANEQALVTRLVRRYCADRHRPADGELCAACAELLAYVAARLARCPYGEAKPTCRRCPVHCYRPQERARIKAVMRYAGPRLLWRGDWGAVLHLLHDLRKPLPPKRRKPAG